MLLIRITIIFKFALIVIIHLDNVNDGSHGAHTLRVKWGPQVISNIEEKQ